MFSLICTWINKWVNNREAGDLRRHRGHYDVNVMIVEELKKNNRGMQIKQGTQLNTLLWMTAQPYNKC